MTFIHKNYTSFHTNSTKRKSLRRFRKALSSFLLLAFISSSYCSGIALADLEEVLAGMSVESGEVEVKSSSSDKLVLIVSDKSILNFKELSVLENETLQFIQDSSESSVLAKVTGDEVTVLIGQLLSNGEIILTNPNGFHFSSDANIDVASLIASTLEVENSAYLNGELTFEQLDSSKFSKILNEANIRVDDEGHIVFLANAIENKGVLTAYKGQIILGTAEKATLSFNENGNIFLVVDKAVSNNLEKPDIKNSGEIHATGGRVVMNAQSFNETMDTLINNTGIVEASTLIEKDGVIELVSNGAIENSGELYASVLDEKGYTFRSSGVIAGGIDENGNVIKGVAFYDNIDGKAFINGSIGSDQYDEGDLIVDGNITLLASVTFGADRHMTLGDCTGLTACDGTGRFSMDPGTQIDGAGFDLTILSSQNSSLEQLININTLTLDESQGSSNPTYTMGSYIYSFGSLNQIIVNNSFLDGASASEIHIGTGGITVDGSTASFRASGAATYVHGDFSFTNNATFDANGGSVHFRADNNSYNVLVNNPATNPFEFVFFERFSDGADQTITLNDITVNGGIWIENGSSSDFTIEGNNATVDILATGGGALNTVANGGIGDVYIQGQGGNKLTFELSGGGSPDFFDSDVQWLTDSVLKFSGSGDSNLTLLNQLYDLEIDKTSGDVDLGGALSVANDITLTSGTLDANGFSIYAGNDFLYGAGSTISNASASIAVDGVYTQNSANGLALSDFIQSFGGIVINAGHLDFSAVSTNDVIIRDQGVQLNAGGTITAPALLIFDSRTGTGNFDFSGGTFNHNSGTVRVLAHGNYDLTFGDNLYDLEFEHSSAVASSPDINIRSNFTIDNNLTFSNTNGPFDYQIVANDANQTISVGGSISTPTSAGSNSVVIGNTGNILTFDLTGTNSSFSITDDVSFGSQSTVRYSGDGTAIFDDQTNGFDGDLDISLIGAGDTVQLSSNLDTSGNLDVNNGILDGASNDITTSNLTVAGGTVDLSTSLALNVTQDFMMSSGSVTGGGLGSIIVGQDFQITGGTFVAKDDMYFTDAGQTSVIDVAGGVTFNNLFVTTPSKVVRIDAGDTVNVTGTFTVTGSAGNLVSLDSQGAGQWNLNAASTSVDFVNVSNSNNIAGGVINPSNSVDGGGNTNWFTAAPPGPEPEKPESPEVPEDPILPIDPIVEDPPDLDPPLNDSMPEKGGDDAADEPSSSRDGGGDKLIEPQEPASDNPVGTNGGDSSRTSRGNNSFDNLNIFGDALPGDEDSFGNEKEKKTTVFVDHGEVNVDGNILYDGESITVGVDGKPVVQFRGVYVASMDEVSVIRAKIHEVLKVFKMRENVSGLAVSKDGSSVYYATPSSNSIHQINAQKLKKSKSIYGLDGGPEDVILSSDGKLAYLALTNQDKIQVVDIASKKKIASFDTGAHPSQMILTQDGKTLFVTTRLNRSVMKIDAKSGEIINEFFVDGSPYDLALSSDEKCLYVSDTVRDQILKIDLASNEVIESVSVGNAPHKMVIDHISNKLFVSNWNSNDVSVVDVEVNLEEKSRIPVGNRPMGLALTPEGHHLYVANSLSGNISLIEPSKNKVVNSITTGAAPTEVVISSPAKLKNPKTFR